jgi:hypothetical protein
VVRPCVKNAIIENQNRLWRPEGRKEEAEEDQGGLGRTGDRCGQEERKDFSRFEETGSR